uniref:Uncharacterized protein n=1 Tax=Anguilla anguilla TaxID=7936 RepID=A0A0E9XVM6_ANGAN
MSAMKSLFFLKSSAVRLSDPSNRKARSTFLLVHSLCAYVPAIFIPVRRIIPYNRETIFESIVS